MARSVRVLVLGGRGYLGGYFHAAFPEALVPDGDIADRVWVQSTLDRHRPDVVINCAGKTGRPNVDWCETHREETLRANVTGATIVLEECLRRDVYLVHISSGCIYAGDNGGPGFTEDDAPNFGGSFYSRTKAWADQVMRDFPVLTLRLRMPFDGTTRERNLIMKLRKYRRVLAEPNSLTYLPDFLQTAQELIDRRARGIYNVVNEGVISPHAIMSRYRAVVDGSHEFEALEVQQLGEVTLAPRSNCLLSTAKLAAAGLRPRPVAEAVELALHDLAAALRPPIQAVA